MQNHRKFRIWTLLVTGFLFCAEAFAQAPSGDLALVAVNPVDAATASIGITQLHVGEQAYLMLAVANYGPDSLPAGTANVVLSIDTRFIHWVTPFSITDSQGNLWTVDYPVPVDGTTTDVSLVNNGSLPSGYYSELLFPIVGFAVGSEAVTCGSTVQGLASDPNGANQGVTSVFPVVAAPPITISGTLYDDANGLNNSQVDGVPSGTTTPMFVNLVDANGNVVATSPVAANGTYSMSAPGSVPYTLQLSTTQGVIGTAAPAEGAPAGWSITGDALAGTSDGSPNGSLTIPAGTSNVVTSFGVDQVPVANPETATITPGNFTLTQTVGGTTYYGIASNNPVLPGGPSGTDAEDCGGTPCASPTVMINTIDAGTLLFYNGQAVAAGASIPNFDPALLEIYGPKGTSGVGFTYSLVDAAGIAGTPVTYSIFTSAPLPVKLVNFGGSLVDEHVLLNWQTESEENFSHFEVQYSTDARTFEYAGSVKPKGSGSHYRFDAGIPVADVTYYRLKMVDADNRTDYSRTISVESGKREIQVYPNPVQDQFYIKGGTPGTYSLHDVTGHLVQKGKIEAGNNVIPTKEIPTGVYVLKVVIEGRRQTMRIQVLK